MNVHTFPTPPAQPPKAPEPKKRIITLTNRAPIRIVEDDWPIIAEGICGEDWGGTSEYGWTIEVRVRRHKDVGERFDYSPSKRHDSLAGYIIHARYSLTDPDGEDDQHVRVGRTLSTNEAAKNLWKHISQIGDELRERIGNERYRKHVVYAIDAVFSQLSPHDIS